MATEKRTIENDNLNFNVSAIIVDIEGTTTSINFVKETLFPYVRENLKGYVESNWSDKEFQEDLSLLKEQASKDLEDKLDGVVEIPDGDSDDVKTSVINNILWQMDNDRKTKALKQLQGHIWKNGYKEGKLVGHIYDEVKDCLKTWSEGGKKIYVYSSGSVEAQKLLFSSTKEGDLLSVFSGYFDTAVGVKTEAGSYSKILDQLKESGHINVPKDALFLTDVAGEAKAATEAGLEAVIVIREGNAPLSDDVKEKFPVIHSFCDLVFEGNTKRRKLSNENLVENKDEKTDKTEEKDVEMDVSPSDSNETEAVVESEKSKETEAKNVTDAAVETPNVEVSNDKVENGEKTTDVKEDVKEPSEPDVEKNGVASEVVDEMEGVETKAVESESNVKNSNDSEEKNAEPVKTEESKEKDASEEKFEEKKENSVDIEVKEVPKNETKVETNEEKNGESEKETNKDETEVKADSETKINNEVSEVKTNGEIKTEDEKPKDKLDVKHETDDKKEKVNEELSNETKESESQNGVAEPTTATLDKDEEQSKVDKSDGKDSENKENNVGSNGTANENSMEVDEKDKSKTDEKTDLDSVDVGKDKLEKDSEKVENSEPLKEIVSDNTDIKTNGSLKENLKNGVADGDKNGVGDEEKPIKEKTVETNTETNSIKTAESN